jgi:hypothetical protein
MKNNIVMLISENVQDGPDLEKIQKKIRNLLHLLKFLDIKEKRDQFRKGVVPVFTEILNWQDEQEAEIKPFIFTVVDGLSVPKPAPPFKQYILIALSIGFFVGLDIGKKSNIESRFREKKIFTKTDVLVPLDLDKNKILKFDFMELSFLVFCGLFFIVLIIENKNILILRFKLLFKIIKKIGSGKKKKYLTNSPHRLFLFEVYG